MIALRWILAVLAGVLAYWVGLLLSLGIFGMVTQNPTAVGQSVFFLGIALGIGTFAGCIASIAAAPRPAWRTMGYIAVAIGIAWAVYGQIYAGHALVSAAIETLSAAIGAGLAFVLASRLFRSTVVS